MEKSDKQIREFVYRVRARLREQSVIDNLCSFVMLGLGFALVISIVSMLIPFYYAVPVATGVLAIAFIVGMIVGVRKTPSPMTAALKADAKGYKEKISTAFFVAGKNDSFSVLLKNEVLEIIKHFSIRKEFPLDISMKRLAVIMSLAVLFVVTSLVSTPAREQARVRHDVGKEVKKEIARLDKVEKNIENNKEISEDEKSEVREQIETAKRKMKAVESREELGKATERIAKKMEMKSTETENKTLSEELSKAASEAEERVREKNEELAESAKEAMDKAQNGSGRDKQLAYEKLKDLADSTGDAELSNAADNYKESGFSDADYASAKAAMNKSLDNKNDMANNSQNNNQNSNQNNSQNSNQNNNQNNGQSNNGQNNNQNKGNSQNNGNTGQNGNSNQGNNGQNGTGGNNGNSAQGNNGNNNGNGGGAGWNYGSKDGKEGPAKTGENITVPEGELGNDENLTGKANGNETGEITKSNQVNTWSGNKVSYGQVSGKYKDKAYKKINGSDYPGKLKDKIRNYFDGLN